MTCKNCGNVLQENNKFCSECGAVVANKETDAVKCSKCDKYFKKEFCVCPFCGTEYAEGVCTNVSINDIETSDISESAISNNDKEPIAKNSESFFSRYKSEILLVSVVAILILVFIIIGSTTETCSQCGETFSEGYTVFGEPWCKDCFYS